MQTPLESYLRRAVLIGLFALPFIGLIIANPLYFPYITGKNFAFRIIVEVIFFAWLYLACANPAYRPKRSAILGALAAFLAIIAVADVFSVNPVKSFWSNFERMEGYITLLHLGLYFLVLTSMLSTKQLWERLFDTSIVASLLVTGYGYLQLFGAIPITQGSTRVDSTLGNASYMAIYLLFHMFLAALLLLRRWGGAGWQRYYYGAVIALEGIALYFTATRGAILGLIGGVLVASLLVALFERERPRLRKGAMALIALTLIVVGGFYALRDSSFVAKSPVLSRFSQISADESGVNARLVIWQMAWQGIKERPILGWGQESFNYVFNTYYDARLYAQEQWFDRVHDAPLDWLVAGGFLGLIAYLSLFLSALWYLFIRNRGSFTVAERALFMGLLAAYFFHNLFVFDNVTSYLLFATVLGYLHTRSAASSAPLFASRVVSEGTLTRIVAPVLLAACVLSLYSFTYGPLAQAHALLSALSRQDSIQTNLNLFKEAVAQSPVGAQEVREQLALSAMSAIPQNIDASVKQQFADLAISEMKTQNEEHPNDARILLFLGSLEDMAGIHDEAISTLKASIALSPNKQQLYFALGNAYLNASDSADALATLKSGLALEPDNDAARVAYAAGAVLAGDLSLADTILKPIAGTLAEADDHLIQAYGRTNHWDRVASLWQIRIAADPSNAQNHVSLAAVYLALNRRQDAVAQLQTAITLDPAFKQQGEYYIGEIEAGRNP